MSNQTELENQVQKLVAKRLKEQQQIEAERDFKQSMVIVGGTLLVCAVAIGAIAYMERKGYFETPEA